MPLLDKISGNTDDSTPVLQNKVSRLYDAALKPYNPFLDKNGNLFNPYINYQNVLDNPNVSAKAKQFISAATGLEPSPAAQVSTQEAYTPSLGAVTPSFGEGNGAYVPQTVGTGEFKDSVGKRVADTAKYNNSAAKGQCVWYVRGRVEEKLGIKLGSMGNGNEMYYNAKKDAQLAATKENIKPNILVSYSKGTSSAGQKYGHVIFVEDVVGDTVYYTEGGSGYYKNGTDGVVKTTTLDGLLQGVNSNGGRMGSGVIGFVDVSKYK